MEKTFRFKSIIQGYIIIVLLLSLVEHLQIKYMINI